MCLGVDDATRGVGAGRMRFEWKRVDVVRAVALAVVAAHGLTDLGDAHFVEWYALGALIPEAWVTPAFLGASVVHFGLDFEEGEVASACMHAYVAAVGAIWGVDDAADCMLVYLSFWHVPEHYRRHLRHERHLRVAIAAVGTLLLVLYALCTAQRLGPGRLSFVLDDRMQRVVVAHTCVELALSFR